MAPNAGAPHEPFFGKLFPLHNGHDGICCFSVVWFALHFMLSHNGMPACLEVIVAMFRDELPVIHVYDFLLREIWMAHISVDAIRPQADEMLDESAMLVRVEMLNHVY